MKKTWIAVLILAVLAVVEKGMNWNFTSRIIRTGTEYVRNKDDDVQDYVPEKLKSGDREHIYFYDPQRLQGARKGSRAGK